MDHLEIGYPATMIVDEERLPKEGTAAALELDEPVVVTMLNLHNRERRYRRMRALLLNLDLAEAAQLHSEDMLAEDYFAHDSQDGTPFYQRIRLAGYRYSRCAENIAWGSGSRGEPQDIFWRWMNSSGHKGNILNPAFKEVGFGVAYGTFKNIRNVAVWTADFGTRR
jgi:uncharacterized protein YkwD